MAKPKLALIPAAQGSKLYSVLPSSGVGDFSFTRSGSATRINAQGLIETVASGVSRLNYPMIDGVVKGCPHHILEPQRTNVITNSESLSNFVKTNITEVSGNQVTPDGTLGSIKITPTSSSLAQIQNASLTVGSAYSISFFVKKDEASHLIINQAGSSATKVSYDIDNLTYIGIAGVNANIVSYGNGWVRIEYSVNSITYNNIRIILSNGTNVYPYNPPVGDGLYIWGFQLEQNSYPTSYIKTTTSAVTRSAETANGSGDAATFNDSEGVLMVEISALSDDSTNRQMTLSDGTDNNRLVLKYDNQSNIIQSFNRVGGVESAFLSASITDITLFSKCLVKYKVNDYQLWINGFKLDTDISAAVWSSSTLNDLKINAGGGSDFYGNVKQIQYFDTALTDSELEQISSWVSFQEMAEGQLYTIQ